MLRRAGVVLTTVTLMLAATAGAAFAWEPGTGAVFNKPTGDTAAKARIVTHVERAINNAPHGSTILISTMLFDRRISSDALVRAHNRRHVHVQVVIDGDEGRTAATRHLATVLNRDNKPAKAIPERWGNDQSFVKFCSGSCRGGGTTTDNHTKFYAFSRVGHAQDVVMFGSSNLNKGGVALGWNDLYTLKNRPAIYDLFQRVHGQMAADKPVSGQRYIQQTINRYTFRFFPMRDGGKANDPTYQDLSRVHCRGANGGAGRDGRTVIKVSMFWWSGDRGLYLAHRLMDLDRNGCDVSIVYGAPSHVVADLLKRNARNGGVKLWDSRYDRNLDGEIDLRVHEKYILINGNYAQDPSSWRVHTGSQNFGYGSLIGGDELTVNIDSRDAYGQYSKNFDYIRTHWGKRIG